MRVTPFALALVLFGCSSSGNVARLSDATYPPLTSEDRIDVTTGDLDVPYEELAVIAVRPGPSWLGRSDAEDIAAMNEKLQAEARQIGAQAVIRVSYDVSGENVRATGTAVRLRQR